MSPPDILITNYKMLDLLLQRAEDAPLWRESDIRYVVVDEFHTYDGAQGTDVGMLLRRLAAAVGATEDGRPLGKICPVATSATLASGTDEDGVARLLDVATHVFGTAFTADSIVGENRLSVEEFIPLGDVTMQPMPTPDELLALPDPTSGGEALLDLIEKVTDVRDLDPFVLGGNLKRHLFTRAVMQALGGEVKTSAEVLDVMWRAGAAVVGGGCPAAGEGHRGTGTVRRAAVARPGSGVLACRASAVCSCRGASVGAFGVACAAWCAAVAEG